MTNNIGNISTIIKWISMYIAGWFIGILINHGINLPIEQEQLGAFITGLIFLAVGYIDSKYPNTFKFLGNATVPVNPEEPVLNDEYECDDDGC